MSSFATFTLLYLTAVYMEFSEKWTYPIPTTLLLLALTLLLVFGVSQRRFLCLLAAITAHVVFVQLPDVANHVNLIAFLNVLLLASLVGTLVGSAAPPSDEAWYESVRPVLQTTMILVYVLAGFHKLNVDFFDPGASCVRHTMSLMRRAARSTVGGLPVAALAAAAVAGIAWLLTPRLPKVSRLGLALAAIVATVGSLALLGVDASAIPAIKRAAMVSMAVVVVLWEIGGGVALAVPALQLPMLVFSWTMHASLALVSFVDFGALVVAMFYNFVPAPQQRLISASSVRVGRRPGGLAVSPVTLYVTGCLVAGLLSPHSRLGAGLVFNAAVLVLVWPIITAAAGRVRWPGWAGVPLRFEGTPWWMRLAPLLLVLHASTSYVGLRTAGNFSMFSNLRTEGEASNHLILAGNPFKIWGYQEDVVHVLAIDDRAAAIGYQYQRLAGHSIPVVEFRKLVYQWTMASRPVAMEFEYAGTRVVTDDVTRDPQWATSTWDWEMQLLDFRVIQPDTPNRCRW